ncbi:MAG: hypothetical protein V4451_07425 [Pseudomonadota bacterium]
MPDNAINSVAAYARIYCPAAVLTPQKWPFFGLNLPSEATFWRSEPPNVKSSLHFEPTTAALKARVSNCKWRIFRLARSMYRANIHPFTASGGNESPAAN